MDIYIARQPIFNTRLEVFAYELLYRSGTDNFSNVSDSDGDSATSAVITNGLMMMGIDELTHGKKSFINFTKNLIVEKIPLLFSNEVVVVELLEDIIPDDDFIEICKELKEKGYILALDDFVLDYDYIELIELADIIKVDFMLTSKEERREIIRRYKYLNIKFLAEKVETLEEFEEAKEAGYTYFQGYFFSKPVIIPGKDIKSYTMNYVKILDELNADVPEYDKISNIIEYDVALTYKLLRLINSPAFYTNSKITSVNHALVLLGFNEIKKWITIIMMRDLGASKPDEIVRASLLRAKMAEQIASPIGIRGRKNELFLVGVFSMIDTLMNRTLFDILSEIPLEIEIVEAILGFDNDLKASFDIVLAYERGDWEKVNKICVGKNVDSKKIRIAYMKALEWTNNIYNS